MLLDSNCLNNLLKNGLDSHVSHSLGRWGSLFLVPLFTQTWPPGTLYFEAFLHEQSTLYLNAFLYDTIGNVMFLNHYCKRNVNQGCDRCLCWKIQILNFLTFHHFLFDFLSVHKSSYFFLLSQHMDLSLLRLKKMSKSIKPFLH